MERAAAMPTRNVNLTDGLDHFVAQKIRSGRYENASEVVRAGLRMLERDERQYEAKACRSSGGDRRRRRQRYRPWQRLSPRP
jgi:putative addiction module CopG family antidote